MPTQTAGKPRPATALLVAAGFALAAGRVLAQGGGDPLAEPFPDVFELSSLLPSEGGDGSLGFVLEGTHESEHVGIAVGRAGDMNGDGVDDVVVSAYSLDRVARVAVYVIFGRSGPSGAGVPALIDLGSLDPAVGFRIVGDVIYRAFARSVAGVGDINGDGFDDLIIGANQFTGVTSPWSGAAYVVFGRDTAVSPAFPSELHLADLDGSNGFRLSGWSTYVPGVGMYAGYELGSGAGWSVSGAGDINGDGYDDLLVGAPAAVLDDSPYAGVACVVFGRDGSTAPFPVSMDLESLDGSDGFRILGRSARDDAGRSVSAAGDVNGDGFDDLLVGAPGELSELTCPMPGSCYTVESGRAYVLFGHDSITTSLLDAVRGDVGFEMHTGTFRANLGWAVAAAGDVNGDGVGDLATGSPGGFGGQDGEAHVLFGRETLGGPSPFPDEWDLKTLAPGDGFRFGGLERGNCGSSLSSLGDVNGDGYDDVLISCPREWTSVVIFGRGGSGADPFPTELRPEDITQRTGVILMDAGSLTRDTRTVSGGGDINGDGVQDLILGSPRSRVGSKSYVGRVYVLYGRRQCPADLDGDGDLTIFDYLEFGSLFDAGDPAADFDGDGELTIFDFLAYQNAFDLGCP
ncbi:MAG: hypothetical protein NCW75_05880 [Phycisphaera sp.]|nr:MAG: hypothetical protein NCW75_05880 [Phycisphaera sp.]